MSSYKYNITTLTNALSKYKLNTNRLNTKRLNTNRLKKLSTKNLISFNIPSKKQTKHNLDNVYRENQHRKNELMRKKTNCKIGKFVIYTDKLKNRHLVKIIAVEPTLPEDKDIFLTIQFNMDRDPFKEPKTRDITCSQIQPWIGPYPSGIKQRKPNRKTKKKPKRKSKKPKKQKSSRKISKKSKRSIRK